MQHGLDGGLYDPASELDSCGFGLIAQVAGDGSRAIVDIALDALSRMAHRGGVAADGLSGDGCGVLLHGVDGFVRQLAADAGIGLHAGPVAAGNVFLPHDAARAAACRSHLDTDHPWNTFTRAGLPPTPIAIPGEAALRAAVNPDKSEFLYFVARGDGSSEFSRNLADHNRAVNKFIRNGGGR